MQNNGMDISDDLMKLIREGINAGFGLIQEDDDDIIPLFITEQAITAMVEQDFNKIFAVIQQLLNSKAIKRGVLVFNGYLTLRGERSRAIMAEGFEQGSEKRWHFAQVYRSAVEADEQQQSRPAERLGNLKLLTGGAELRFS